MASSQLGVVAIGRNEGERLKRCLRSLPAGASIVYVDSGSSDESVPFALQTGAEVVELDLSRPFTAARARNEGLSCLLSSSPETRYVQFVDGDCELEQDWAIEAMGFLERNPSVAVVCGRRRERFKNASIYNGWMDEEWNTPVGPSLSCGGDALMRTTVVREAGGYDDDLVAGEEPELCARLRNLGWTIYRLDLPMSVHDADMHRFRQWWLRAVRSGYGYAQVRWKTGSYPMGPLYNRELARAFLWTIGVSGIAMALALAIGAEGLLLAAVIWGVQFARLSARNGLRKAACLMLGKWAEMFGALKFAAAAVLMRPRQGIVYK